MNTAEFNEGVLAYRTGKDSCNPYKGLTAYANGWYSHPRREAKAEAWDEGYERASECDRRVNGR
jgi:hypothetical protein